MAELLIATRYGSSPEPEIDGHSFAGNSVRAVAHAQSQPCDGVRSLTQTILWIAPKHL